MDFKIIAVDFDGTLCENKWPEIGEPNLKLIEYLKKRRAAGDKLILWTCRVDERLYEAVSWCANLGLEFDIVNRNLPETLEWMGGDSRKIFADEYIDDRNAWYPMGEVSDGYHTFDSLYHQRCILFAALCNTFPNLAWKSHKHEDGEECFGGGWFIVGIDTPKGSYTYHYENEHWDKFKCRELEVAPKWDGHTDKDVERLLSIPASILVKNDIYLKNAEMEIIKNQRRILNEKKKNGELIMWKRELIKNKIYAVLFVVLGALSVPIEWDATFFVFSLMVGGALFFSKENWIMD